MTSELQSFLVGVVRFVFLPCVRSHCFRHPQFLRHRTLWNVHWPHCRHQFRLFNKFWFTMVFGVLVPSFTLWSFTFLSTLLVFSSSHNSESSLSQLSSMVIVVPFWFILGTSVYRVTYSVLWEDWQSLIPREATSTFWSKKQEIIFRIRKSEYCVGCFIHIKWSVRDFSLSRKTSLHGLGVQDAMADRTRTETPQTLLHVGRGIAVSHCEEQTWLFPAFDWVWGFFFFLIPPKDLTQISTSS